MLSIVPKFTTSKLVPSCVSKQCSGLSRCYLRWAHNSTESHSNTSNNLESSTKNNVKTMKLPKRVHSPSRHLRRSFVPSYNLPKSSFDVQNIEQRLTSQMQTKICTIITTGEKYKLDEAIKALNRNDYRPSIVIPDEIIAFGYRKNGTSGDVMVIAQTGSLVSWGLDEETVKKEIVPLIQEACVNPLADVDFESEDMDYVELSKLADVKLLNLSNSSVGDVSLLAGDLIIINSIDPDLGLLDKAAFASGLSRSTTLAVLENTMEKHILNTRVITEKISKGAKINLKESDALKSIGKLFLIRGRLNLYSELIETPDLYWSEPHLERIFKNVSRYLDIAPRISILNSKLDYCTDECRALISLLSEKKSTFLEWIIIYLITVEVCFELYHFYERYWLTRDKSLPTSILEIEEGGSLNRKQC